MGDQEGSVVMSEQDVLGFDDVTVEELEEASGGVFTPACAWCAACFGLSDIDDVTV
jgi:hypothetical protein